MKKRKCKVLRDYFNDQGKKRKAGTTISLSDTSAKMRAHGGFVEILDPDKKPVAPKPVIKKKAAAIPKPELKKPETKMKKCKVLVTFFDGRLRKIGKKIELTDAAANTHALAGRVKIMKPRKKAAAKKKAVKKPAAKKKPAAPALTSDKKSAGALAKPRPKKKPAAKKKGKKKNA